MRTNIIRHTFSKVKPLKVSVVSLGDGCQAKSQTGKEKWEIHNPLEVLLSALAACELSTLRAISGKTQFKVQKVNFTRVESSLDIAKFMKGGKQSKLEQIFIQAQVQMNGTQQQLKALMEKVENSCPVYQMISQSGVKINTKYELLK